MDANKRECLDENSFAFIRVRSQLQKKFLNATLAIGYCDFTLRSLGTLARVLRCSGKECPSYGKLTTNRLSY